MVDLGQTLTQLGQLLYSLGSQLLVLLGLLVQLALNLWLVIAWVAWWLLGVNWNRLWPVLRQGGWMPLVLLMIGTALAWSQIAPGTGLFLGFLAVPNFWWQLGWVIALVLTALFCGWLQGVLDWAPAEINLDPPAAADHGHAHH